MHVEIMELALETLRTIADLLRYKIGQASLLACLDFVILKAIKMFVDVQRLRFGLIWNMHAALFYPKHILKLQGKINTQELSSSQENVPKEMSKK